MRDHHDQMSTVLPVVVTFTDDIGRLDAYREHLGINTPVLADPERSLYRAVGAGRGSLRRVWSPGTLAMYAKLLRRGRRLRPPTEDTRQLGADLLVDADGRLRRLWLPEGPDLRPSVEELVAAVWELGRV
ncbi:MAG: AhpC/TSA family protein [Ilumatobacteraceae bacterium]